MNFDTNGRIAKVNLVASSILSSNDRRGALRFFRKHRPINPVAPHVSFLPRATCGTETRHDENGGLEEVGNAQKSHLPEPRLLDATHIVMDADEQLGQSSGTVARRSSVGAD